MSWILHDPDEWETVSESRPCTACGPGIGPCIGRCNGMFSIGQRRRDPAEVAKIKAERRLREENDILAKAEEIKARRAAEARQEGRSHG